MHYHLPTTRQALARPQSPAGRYIFDTGPRGGPPSVPCCPLNTTARGRNSTNHKRRGWTCYSGSTRPAMSTRIWRQALLALHDAMHISPITNCVTSQLPCSRSSPNSGLRHPQVPNFRPQARQIHRKAQPATAATAAPFGYLRYVRGSSHIFHNSSIVTPSLHPSCCGCRRLRGPRA